MTKYIFSFLLLFFSLNFGYSQNRIVKGLVIDEDLEPIGNLLISINDSIKVGTTDIEGRFQIEIPTSVNKISFACIGYERTELNLSDDCDNIELVMLQHVTHCFLPWHKVNKLRRKEYKKLPMLRKKAYEKGVFQSPEVCYTQGFAEYIFVNNKLTERINESF